MHSWEVHHPTLNHCSSQTQKCPELCPSTESAVLQEYPHHTHAWSRLGGWHVHVQKRGQQLQGKTTAIWPQNKGKMKDRVVWSMQVALILLGRITKCFGLEGTFRSHLAQPSCSEQGHLQLDQVTQSPIQPGLESFQGWGLHYFSGQPVPGFHHPHCKKFPPYIQSKSTLKPSSGLAHRFPQLSRQK